MGICGGNLSGQLSQMNNLAGLSGLGQAQDQARSHAMGSPYMYGRDHQYWDAHIRRDVASIIKKSDPATELKQELQSDLDEHLKDWDK